jgi:hypothetical protein
VVLVMMIGFVIGVFGHFTLRDETAVDEIFRGLGFSMDLWVFS